MYETFLFKLLHTVIWTPGSVSLSFQKVLSNSESGDQRCEFRSSCSLAASQCSSEMHVYIHELRCLTLLIIRAHSDDWFSMFVFVFETVWSSGCQYGCQEPRDYLFESTYVHALRLLSALLIDIWMSNWNEKLKRPAHYELWWFSAFW